MYAGTLPAWKTAADVEAPGQHGQREPMPWITAPERRPQVPSSEAMFAARTPPAVSNWPSRTGRADGEHGEDLAEGVRRLHAAGQVVPGAVPPFRRRADPHGPDLVEVAAGVHAGLRGHEREDLAVAVRVVGRPCAKVCQPAPVQMAAWGSRARRVPEPAGDDRRRRTPPARPPRRPAAPARSTPRRRASSTTRRGRRPRS